MGNERSHHLHSGMQAQPTSQWRDNTHVAPHAGEAHAPPRAGSRNSTHVQARAPVHTSPQPPRQQNEHSHLPMPAHQLTLHRASLTPPATSGTPPPMTAGRAGSIAPDLPPPLTGSTESHLSPPPTQPTPRTPMLSPQQRRRRNQPRCMLAVDVHDADHLQPPATRRTKQQYNNDRDTDDTHASAAQENAAPHRRPEIDDDARKAATAPRHGPSRQGRLPEIINDLTATATTPGDHQVRSMHTETTADTTMMAPGPHGLRTRQTTAPHGDTPAAGPVMPLSTPFFREDMTAVVPPCGATPLCMPSLRDGTTTVRRASWSVSRRWACVCMCPGPRRCRTSLGSRST